MTIQSGPTGSDQASVVDVNPKSSPSSVDSNSERKGSVTDRMRADFGRKQANPGKWQEDKGFGQPKSETKVAGEGSSDVKSSNQAVPGENGAAEAESAEARKGPEPIPYHAFKKKIGDVRKQVVQERTRAERAEQYLKIALERVNELAQKVPIDDKDKLIKQYQYEKQLGQLEREMPQRVQREVEQLFQQEDSQESTQSAANALLEDARQASKKSGGRLSVTEILAIQRANANRPMTADEVVRRFAPPPAASAPALPKMPREGSVPPSQPKSGSVRKDMVSYFNLRRGV